MCGITGYTDFSSDTNPSVLSKMTDEIIYRGPDSSGHFVSKNKKAGLGVRRLSIIDLVTGDQPINNEDGSLTVVYNGEIYNYRELVKELKKDGHKFRTESDTEVLVHLYEKYGYQMTKYLNGMFAFAIWDDNKQELFLARDRSGIKPLYFWHQGQKLVFGSEVKTILKYPGFAKKIDKEALSLYCYFGYIPSEKSMFAGVQKLLPGHTLTFSKRGVVTRKFFEISTKTNEETSLEDLLRSSVVSQLHADVPVGVFLSGGVDSSLLSYFISEVKSLKSFSIGFAEESFDESRFAKIVAKRLGTKHYSETFDVGEVPSLYNETTRLLDEPLADASFLPTYKVSRLARKHVKVALSGDGGDELFGGYPTYQAQLIAEKIKHLPKFVLDSSVFLLNLLPESGKNYPKKELARIFLKAVPKNPVDRHLYMMRTFFRGEGLLYKKPDFAWFDKTLPDMNGIASPDRKAQIVDFYTYLRDDFLVKTDRASMYNSLEVRVPYLDNGVIDFAYGFPGSHVNLLGTKILLRKLLKKFLPEVSKRPKKGFGIPLAKWIREELKDFSYGVLANPKLYDFVGKEKIDKIWDEHQEKRQNNAGSIWMLVMLSGWLNNWA